MTAPDVAFYHDERCFWHGGGNYAETLPVGGLVQPSHAGLPEDPETKRRFRNLIEVTGLARELDMTGGTPATEEDLRRVHPASYLDAFRALSDTGGGELGARTPFLPGGYEIAAVSAGLTRSALFSVLDGRHRAAYALSRPPGHHCLADTPMGFCLLANIAIAVKAALAEGRARRVAVIDWDVHHGNGTEALFIDNPDVLTVSLHQYRNFPNHTGDAEVTGDGPGRGCNVNIPLPPGTGHDGYLAAWDRIVAPRVRTHAPDVIIIACGFDASAIDPLGRMLCHSETFGALTQRAMELADDCCQGRLVLSHEGGYSAAYVPFCGHAVMQRLARSSIAAPDPLLASLIAKQPPAALAALIDRTVAELAEFHLP